MFIFKALYHINSIIRILSEKTISIIKRIKINEVDNQGRYHTAEIIYLRTFSNEYKMQQKEVVDEKEDFKRMIYGIPENEYPSDMLDKDLLEVVQQKYPTAKVKSSLMLFNSELRDFEQEIRNYHYYNTITLILEPDFQEIMKLVDYLDCLKFQFNLYVSSLEEKKFFGNMYFSLNSAKYLPLMCPFIMLFVLFSLIYLYFLLYVHYLLVFRYTANKIKKFV